MAIPRSEDMITRLGDLVGGSAPTPAHVGGDDEGRTDRQGAEQEGRREEPGRCRPRVPGGDGRQQVHHRHRPDQGESHKRGEPGEGLAQPRGEPLEPLGEREGPADGSEEQAEEDLPAEPAGVQVPQGVDRADRRAQVGHRREQAQDEDRPDRVQGGVADLVDGSAASAGPE